MIKKIIIFVSFLLRILLTTILYLSIFGFETTKFNKIISDKINNNYPGIDLKLDKVKIITKPIKLKIDIITEQPK